MTRVSRKRVVEGISLILGSLTCLFFIWYAHFVLKRTPLVFTVFASLFFGSGLLAGSVALKTPYDDPRWFIVNPQHLTPCQNITLAVGGLIFAICSLWFAWSQDIREFIEKIVGGGQAYLLFKVICIVGFFYFSWHAWLKFKHAFRKK